MTSIPPADSLLDDPLLRDAQTIEGFKVLDPAVLYAKVGQGGMGAVYRGRHCKLDLDVAVKCLKPSLAAESPEFVARFEREARLCASLAHQNVVRVMDVQQKAGLHYLVMEFVRGESVRERVQRKGPLPLPEALAILHGACAGLAEAHARGIVHRDIKPDNLLVSIEGRVKLADLGLAKAPAGSGHSLSIASAVMGTPQYMAPEQWETPDVGPAADVWALGATLYFVLTGEHGIEGASFAAMARAAQERDFPALAAKCPQAPRAVLDLFARCVARQPQQRFASAKELLAALAPLVTVGEDALADAAAGSNQARLGVVTPPPRETLLRIRARLETPTAVRSAVAAADEQNTVRSPADTQPAAAPVPPRRAVVQLGWPWLVGAPLLLLGAVVGAYLLDTGDDAEWAATERFAQARSLHGDAMQLLPQADGLDPAITKLERALELVPAFTSAKAPLAMALDKRSERLTETDLDGAFVAIARALELDPANAAVVARHEALQGKLRARLLFGLTITEPADDTVLVGPKFAMRGKVPAAGITRVELSIVQVDRKDAPTVTVQAPVVAGEFTATLTAPDAGRLWLGLAAVDRHGVRGGTLPLRVFMPGVCGALGKGPDPRATPPQVVWNGAGMAMQPIPVRTFRMGSLDLELGRDDDEKQHEVTLTEPFWLGATEVTQQQWFAVMRSQPWASDGDRGEPDSVPATMVTAPMAEAFCAQLTERERDAGRLPDGYRYALPTEAQWELAARGGGSVVWPHGDDAEVLAEHAVFGDEAGSPKAVGERPANPFGLHDLAGNVEEWCADLATGERDVTTFTYVDGQVEPLSAIGLHRVVRGGNCTSPANDCRVAARVAMAPDTALPTLGFRVALCKRAE